MSVDVSHLVLKPLRDADDEVVDEGADGAQGGDALAVAVVHFDVDDIFRWVREADAQVAQVLAEFAPRALDGDVAGFDLDFDCGVVLLVCEWCGERELAFRGFIRGWRGDGSRRTALWNHQLLFRVDCPHVGRVLAGMRWCW